MSSSMRNFMEAYAAVHNTEAKEELTSVRDEISEMHLSALTDTDLDEIVESVLEEMFQKGYSVDSAHAIFSDMFVESNIAGRQAKIDRLCEALNKAFDIIDSKASSIALEEFAKYRNNKKLQESWSARFNQEKRVQRTHNHLVAQESLNVKTLLLQLVEKKADKDYDGDGEIESGTDEYMGSRDKAIKKAMGEKECPKCNGKGCSHCDGKGTHKEEYVDEAITSEKGKAKMKAMLDARTTASGRAKAGKGENVAQIKHIGRANVDGYGGTPPNLKVAKNPVKSNFTGLRTGRGNKAARRAGTYKEEYEVTMADKKGNTKAYQNYKAGMKNVKTGKPMYKAGKGVEEGFDMIFDSLIEEGYSKSEALKIMTQMALDELYKGKHGQSEKEYADSRSEGGKMVSGTSKMSGAEYTHGRRVKAANPGMQPDVGGKTKPKSQGRMDRGTRADLEYRKANLKAGK